MIAILAVLAPAAVAAGKDAPPQPQPVRAWLGTFAPAQAAAPCADCKGPRVVARAGTVRLLPPADGSAVPTEGDVVIASPLLGLAVHGRIDAGRVPIGFFAFDQRDS